MFLFKDTEHSIDLIVSYLETSEQPTSAFVKCHAMKRKMEEGGSYRSYGDVTVSFKGLQNQDPCLVP